MGICTDCDYCGDIRICFEDEGHGTCCLSCSEKHGIKPMHIAGETEDDQPPMPEDDGLRHLMPY